MNASTIKLSDVAPDTYIQDIIAGTAIDLMFTRNQHNNTSWLVGSVCYVELIQPKVSSDSFRKIAMWNFLTNWLSYQPTNWKID